MNATIGAETKRISAFVTVEQWESLTRISKESGLSTSSQLRQAIDEYVINHSKPVTPQKRGRKKKESK